jgi:hypothetical protein
MKKGKNKTIEFVCDRCGKSAPLDEKHSNENWTAFNIKDPCECGGKFIPKLF